jgi:hypothetical protein
MVNDFPYVWYMGNCKAVLNRLKTAFPLILSRWRGQGISPDPRIEDFSEGWDRALALIPGQGIFQMEGTGQRPDPRTGEFSDGGDRATPWSPDRGIFRGGDRATPWSPDRGIFRGGDRATPWSPDRGFFRCRGQGNALIPGQGNFQRRGQGNALPYVSMLSTEKLLVLSWKQRKSEKSLKKVVEKSKNDLHFQKRMLY